jgi:hypothetical protein
MSKREVKYYMDKGIPVAKVIINRGTRSFPILGILTIIFVIAKLFDKLDWSWFMVFWPLWIIPAIFIGIFLAIVLFCILILLGALILDWLSSDLRSWWRRRKRRND